MKYLAIAALIFAGTSASADLLTWSKNAGLEPKAPDAAYRVETKGLDVRVYEWTPADAPHMTCLMAWGQTHPAGLQCFAKNPTAEAENSD
jgi:hypothetical protein